MKKQLCRLPLGLTFSFLLFFSSLSLHAQNYRFAKGFTNTAILGGTLATRSIAVDGTGNMYIMGTFTATADFDPGSGVANLTSLGSSDIYFAKYDPSGNYIYARSIGGNANETVG